MLAAIATDGGAGVDPLSLVIGYKQSLLLAALYDPVTGLVLWPLSGAPKIGVGRTSMIAVASDYQESKNVDQAGRERASEHGVPLAAPARRCAGRPSPG